jgi:hypothetical protein
MTVNLFYDGTLIDTIYEFEESYGIYYYIDTFYENIFQPFFELDLLAIRMEDDEYHIYIPKNTPTIQLGYTFDSEKYRAPFHPSFLFYTYFNLFSVLDTQIIYVDKKYDIYHGTLIEYKPNSTFNIINSIG